MKDEAVKLENFIEREFDDVHPLSECQEKLVEAINLKEKVYENVMTNMLLIFRITKGDCYRYVYNHVKSKDYFKNQEMLREFLEYYEERTLPQICDNIGVPEKITNVKMLFKKLQLLVYDALIYGNYQESYQGEDKIVGYKATTNVTGLNYNITPKIEYGYTDTKTYSYLSRDKKVIYKKARKVIAEQIKQYDKDYPMEYGTWSFNRIDINEINRFVKEVYNTEVKDLCDYNIRISKDIKKASVGIFAFIFSYLFVMAIASAPVIKLAFDGKIIEERISIIPFLILIFTLIMVVPYIIYRMIRLLKNKKIKKERKEEDRTYRGVLHLVNKTC